MKTYRIKKPFSKKKIALAYAISVIISLLMPFIPIYKHLGWGRLVLFNKEFFELYNPFLVVSCIILFFHVFLPFVGVFFVSIFADKTEVYFEEDTIVIFDKNKKELTTINHNQIIDIISDASVEIFYDNTSIKLKSTIWTRSNDFAEVLRNLNEIKSSKIIKHNENQEVFKGKAIIFTNLLYYILEIIIVVFIFILFLSYTFNILLYSEFILFINRVLYLSGKVFMIPLLLIPFGLMYFLYKIQLETLIFDFTNSKELKIKRKNEILTINPKEVKSTSITINPALKSYNLSVNEGLKIQFIKLENPCFVDRYTELFSNFEKTEHKGIFNGTTIIKFVSREC